MPQIHFVHGRRSLSECPGQPIVLTLYGPDGELAVPLLPKRALTLAQALAKRGYLNVLRRRVPLYRLSDLGREAIAAES